MTVRSPSEIYQYLIGAGFSPAGATTMTAIAGAESSYNDTARGDLGLQTSVWGPSYGLFQIRTLKQQTGTGQDRDISALVDPARQAKAAYDISNKGTDFSPWSTYTDGSYQHFLGTASAAGSTNATTASFSANPLDWPAQALDAAKSIVLEGVFIVLGLGLVGFGLARTFQPQIKRAKQKAEKGAALAATVVAPEAAPAIAAASKAKEAS